MNDQFKLQIPGSAVAIQPGLIHASQLRPVSAEELEALFSSDNEFERTPVLASTSEALTDGREAATSGTNFGALAAKQSGLIHASQLRPVSAEELEALFSSGNESEGVHVSERTTEAQTTVSTVGKDTVGEFATGEASSGGLAADRVDRRLHRRAQISVPVRLQSIDATSSRPHSQERLSEQQEVQKRKSDEGARGTLFRESARILSVRNPCVPTAGTFIVHGASFVAPDEVALLSQPDDWVFIWLGKCWRFKGSIKTVSMEGGRMWMTMTIHDTPKEDKGVEA
jgi:hypothetical protein